MLYSKSGLWEEFGTVSAINFLPCYVVALFGTTATGVHESETCLFFPALLEKKSTFFLLFLSLLLSKSFLAIFRESSLLSMLVINHQVGPSFTPHS